MRFDDMLDKVYDNHDLVEWVENASRDALALRYMELMARYRLKSRDLKQMTEIANDASWQRDPRQQQRMGAWM